MSNKLFDSLIGKIGSTEKIQMSFCPISIASNAKLTFNLARDGKMQKPLAGEKSPTSGFVKKRKTVNYFFNKSRISISNSWSLVGPAGAGAGAASSFFFKLFITFMSMKMQKATIVKSNTV